MRKLLMIFGFLIITVSHASSQQPTRPRAPISARQVAATPVPINNGFSILFDHNGTDATHFRLFEDPPGTTTPEVQIAEIPVSSLMSGVGTFVIKPKTVNGTFVYRLVARNAPANMAAVDSLNNPTISVNIFTPTAPQPIPPGNVRIVITATIGANGTITNTVLESITVVR